MRRIVSLLATAAMAAGLSLSSATPAAAAETYCFGLPSEPLAYICVTVGEPTVPDPTITWGEPVPVAYVPAVCYGLGCTEEGPVYVSIPWVSGVGAPTFIEVHYDGLDRLNPKDLVAQIRYIVENPSQLCPMIHPDLVCNF